MDTTTLIDRYCLAWTEPDAGRRSELLASIWAPDAPYTDPSVHAANAKGIQALLNGRRAWPWKKQGK